MRAVERGRLWLPNNSILMYIQMLYTVILFAKHLPFIWISPQPSSAVFIIFVTKVTTENFLALEKRLKWARMHRTLSELFLFGLS